MLVKNVLVEEMLIADEAIVRKFTHDSIKVFPLYVIVLIVELGYSLKPLFFF